MDQRAWSSSILTFVSSFHLAGMFLAVLGTLFATLSADGACDAVGSCQEGESLLQALSKGEVQSNAPSADPFAGTFCPEFFQAEDVQYASMGVQQAEELFVKYCLNLGVRPEHCEEHAEAVFRPEGEGGQELTNAMCTDLLALAARATETMPESANALLARKANRGREDESRIDGALSFKPRRRRRSPTVAPVAPTPRRRAPTRGPFYQSCMDDLEENADYWPCCINTNSKGSSRDVCTCSPGEGGCRRRGAYRYNGGHGTHWDGHQNCCFP